MFHGIPRDSDDNISVLTDNSEARKGNESHEVSIFDRLPIEVFLHICSFLDVKDMIVTLSRVCRRFNEILSDENVWKSWVARRFSPGYPIIAIENDFDWRGACFDIEKEWNLWRAKDEKIDYINVNDVHISSCDSVIFVNSGSRCISGSRDRSMVIWNPLLLKERPRPYIHHQVAHDGWIWRLMDVHNTIYSCSWDNTVKSWSFDGSGSLLPISTFSCSFPALAMTSLEGLIIAGDYGKTVYAFDPRVKPEPQFTYRVHQGAVLTLGSYESDIISGSEDRSIVIWDTRKKCLRQKIELGRTSYPNCSCTDGKNLYVGDNKGRVHVFTTICGETSFVSSFEMDHSKAISVIKHGRGYLITGSLDGTIKISIPSQPPKVMATVKSNGGQVGGLDYYNGMLATGSANCVEFWIPKELFKDKYSQQPINVKL